MMGPLAMTLSRLGRVLVLVGSLVSPNLLASDPHPLGAGDFHARLAHAHRLADDLPATRIQALCDWLARPTAEPGEATLKNDALNRLRAQKQSVKQLPELLIAMADNPEMSLTLRDYALQHLGTLSTSRIAESPVSQALWQATTWVHDSRAGTALLALARRQSQHPQLGPKALELAGMEDAAVQTRIPALLVCGQLGQRAVLPIARELSQDTDQSLAMAAIATLGQVGQHDDLERLVVLQLNPSPRIIHAALAAYEQLKARLDGGLSL